MSDNSNSQAKSEAEERVLERAASWFASWERTGAEPGDDLPEEQRLYEACKVWLKR